MPFLENYLSQTQQAAIKGRQLHNVLLNIKSIIDYVNDISYPLALLQLDFAKAFDNVFHKFILSLMRNINLPPALIQWTTNLLLDTSAKILVNHTLTNRIPISTGIRQGCPLSMLLFSMATDVSSKKISSSSSIKGLSLGYAKSASIKLQQYADDTILFLTYPSEAEVESSRTHFEVLGLEASSPRKLPCPRLEDSTIFEPLKFRWKTPETLRKICKNLFLVSSSRDRLKKCIEDLFFFLENTCVCVFGPWPWPRALCPRLHLWSEVNPALQLIQDFSSHANLQINRKKTTILSNNNHLSDEIKKHLPEAKYPHEAKILGIRFSLIFSTLKQNWSCLTGIIKGIADSHKHRNFSMHIKLLLIKTLLLPHITITARVF